MLIKDLISYALSSLYNLTEKNKKENIKDIKLTEEDILKAIDDLEGDYQPSPYSYDKETNYIKVKSPGVWSSFQYLYKPNMVGLEDIKEDSRPYFTMPVGWGFSEDGLESEYYYITFALDNAYNNITEFMTKTKLDDLMYVVE